jgi:predicted AAA+ superfamily ATPase
MIDRLAYLERLAAAVNRSPVTALLGPRQSGKTTLARAFAQGKPATIFDLESQPDRMRLQNPEMMLDSLQGLVVLDEIQTMPELFEVLRVLVDREDSREKRRRRYLILGSASPALVKRASESLAGRVEFVELSGFNLAETGNQAWRTLWLRGGFPRAYLAQSDEDSLAWREGFIRTFLERDIPQLGITIPAAAMRRFWTMLAHYHGQVWNASELARSMSVSDKTARAYLDILTGTYMVRQLQPWFENIGKRQVKSPKIYLRDTGLLHSLLGLVDLYSLAGHPKVGASWEGFVIEQVHQAVRPAEMYFWATHGGAELDLFMLLNGRRIGVEVKYSEAPRLTPSMRSAIQVLRLERLWVVYPGEQRYPIHDQVMVVPVDDLRALAGDG